MYQDAHIHIQDIKNAPTIELFQKEIFSNGFGRVFNCAITPADWLLIKSYAEKDSRVVPFFGFHPWFADLADTQTLEQLTQFLSWPKAFAGEMGLDRARKNIDFELQKDVFAKQLDLANRFQRPFAVHCVRAWQETISLIKRHTQGLKFLLHSFNGSQEIAQEITELGGYFSIPVRQFLKTDDPFKEVFAALPTDRILIETDFPYQVKWISPNDYIVAVRQGYQNAANWKGMIINEFIAKVYDNGTVFTDRTSHR